MKPASFDYHRATSLDHAAELLAEFGDDAKILAGGQSLIAAMNYRLARPSVLVDVSNIDTPNAITPQDGGIRIKATTTQRTVEKNADVRDRMPVLANAIEHIAHFQIRNKGTLGGSIVNADPASELPAMSLLLDAEFEIRNAGGAHRLPADEFFITYMTTALQSDEVLTSVLFRTPPPGSGWGFHEIARRAGDFALVGSAALVGLDGGGVCNYARAVLFGVAATPVRATDVEDAMVGQRCTAELIDAAAENIDDVLDPESDVHVTEAWRRRTARVLMGRALRDAHQRAQALDSAS